VHDTQTAKTKIKTRMKDILTALSDNLPFVPTEEQYNALAMLARFAETRQPLTAFILRGYAGTGKTSLVSAFVRGLKETGTEPVLLAPTGRAAKVFSLYSGVQAYTVHKAIYRQKTFNGEDTDFDLGYNKRKNAVFIVDEASMISNEGGSMFGSGRLLDDLVSFVYQGAGCKLLLVGDTAQLPPVGEELSPALNNEALKLYGLTVGCADLRQVMRQDSNSGVLTNATGIRMLVAQGEPDDFPKISVKGFNDIRYLSGGELIEELESCYDDVGSDQTVVVTRSNKRAIVYNRGIRARIYEREGDLSAGDRVMVVKNNYFWAALAAAESNGSDAPQTDFIANGDIAEVRHVRNVHSMHGFRFADATLRFPDYDDCEFEARVLLDTLDSEAPALKREESLRLYQSVVADYQDIRNRRERMKRLRQDPYYNALQIKYAYAITCHKAQGGQWSRVFLDQGYTPADMLSLNYLRWLYTAFTRTTERLYLVNWPKNQRAETDEFDF